MSPRRGVALVREESAEEVRRLYMLVPDDLTLLLDTVRGNGHRLALALQLVWARTARVLDADPASLPSAVIRAVADQLALEPEILTSYRSWSATRAADIAVISQHLGVRPFTSEDGMRLHEFLREKVAQTGNTAALLDAAEEWLLKEGILHPAGETTIDRILYGARALAEERLFAVIANQLDARRRDQFDDLCRTEGKVSRLAEFSHPPQLPSRRSVAIECERLELIRAVLPAHVDWGPITTNRRRQWAAVVRRQTAQAVRRYPPSKRYTLILAFLSVRREEVTDTIVDMFDALIGRVFSHSSQAVLESRLEQAQIQTQGARLLRTIAELLLDPSIPPHAVRQEIFRRIPREQVSAALEQTSALENSEVEALFQELRQRYSYVRSFAPQVLRTLSFGSPRVGNEVLQALEVLARMNAHRQLQVPAEAPLEVVPQRWAKAVLHPEGTDRRGWELCVLSEARAALRAGDLTVVGSRRYTAWDSSLYSPAAWEARRASWLAERGLPRDGRVYVERELADLDAVTRQVTQRLPRNASARIERGKLALTALERVEVPDEVEAYRSSLLEVLRSVDVGLPDLLMEVDHWTGFTSALTHLTGRRPPSPQHLAAIRPALFAVLIAEATNLGLSTMARASGIPVGQLTRVADWYLREETLRAAITALIRFHQCLPLTEAFGEGTTSSSDGLRFGVAASALNARHLPQIFGRRRGLTVYSHLSDQGTQFWVDVVNCQLREATFVLDGLLYQDAPPIQEHYTDTHGYTDQVFGLCSILGYRFAPWLRDLPDQLLYRSRRDVDYGALNPVLRQSLRPELLVRHWDDLNRLAASLKDGLVAPSLIIAKLQALRRQNPLQQALQELGRVAKDPAHLELHRRRGAQAPSAGRTEPPGALARHGTGDLLRPPGPLR